MPPRTKCTAPYTSGWITASGTRFARARCGEILLPRQASSGPATSHALRIETDADVQLYLSHVADTNLPLCSKRLIPALENGRLQFTVTKKSAQPEGLMLRRVCAARLAAPRADSSPYRRTTAAHRRALR